MHRVRRGVYAVGHDGLSLEGRWLAAVLALGDGAVLSDRSAAGRVAGHLVDFHWPAVRLVVETDGYAFHRGRSRFEADHRRELDLAAAGYLLRRFSFGQVSGDPDRIAASLAAVLSPRG